MEGLRFDPNLLNLRKSVNKIKGVQSLSQSGKLYGGVNTRKGIKVGINTQRIFAPAFAGAATHF